MTAGGTDASVQRGQGLAAWRQIADAIEAEIATGLLAADHQLPTEALLSARFGVNRHTVRRALADLASRGLVRATRGRGTFVESRPLPYRIGARTRFSENVGRAGREADGELLDGVALPAEGAVALALALAAGEPVLQLRTCHRADGVVISIAQTWLPLPRFAGFAEAFAAGGSVSRAFATYGVADYLRNSTRISARIVAAEEAAMLDLAAGRVVLQTDSVNVDRDGVPIQATRSVFAADRVEFVVEP